MRVCVCVCVCVCEWVSVGEGESVDLGCSRSSEKRRVFVSACTGMDSSNSIIVIDTDNTYNGLR